MINTCLTPVLSYVSNMGFKKKTKEQIKSMLMSDRKESPMCKKNRINLEIQNKKGKRK